MLPEICRSQPKVKSALVALAQLAAIGCGSLFDDLPERKPAAGEALDAAAANAASDNVTGLGQALAGRQLYAAPTGDPIVGVGHGAMALPDGSFGQPTPEFARMAQQYYKQHLLEEVTSDEGRAEYEALRAQLEPAAGDDREFVDNALLINWLIEHVQPADASRLASINKYLAKELSSDLPVELAIKQGDDTSRADYIARCKAARVPIPPKWNPDDRDPTNEWKKRGQLTPDFIGGDDTIGTVWYYEPKPTEPRGVCIALPRTNIYTGQIDLLGVICQGNETSKACFWDNAEKMDPTFSTEIIGAEFNGGSDLEGACGGICTQCHRGENVFIVHPGSALDLGPSLLRADDWVEPFVPTSWHQNPKPTAPSPLKAVARRSDEGSCLDCHSELGSAGGLGLLAEGYCNIVLTAITDQPVDPTDSTPQPARTMPPMTADYHKLTPSDEAAIREICAGAIQVQEPRNPGQVPPPMEPEPEPEPAP